VHAVAHPRIGPKGQQRNPTNLQAAPQLAPNEGGSVISPDGHSVAFVAVTNGTPRLWIRALDSLTARELQDTDGAKLPFWSPDSRAIGFFTSSDLRRIDVSGAAPIVIARALDSRGGTWNADGTIVFSPNSVGPLYQVSASGGTPTPLTALSAGEIDAPLPEDIGELLDLGERIEEAMARDIPAPVACHNDLLAENFILGEDGRMWVIDWEYGGVNDPYYDLGVLCAENPLTADEERAVIDRYCGGMDAHRYARMMLYKIVSDLWWSLWAMLQARFSHLDFDYFSYGMDRVARLKRNAAHPDFHAWLQAV
jgi:hypothetical protein